MREKEEQEARERLSKRQGNIQPPTVFDDNLKTRLEKEMLQDHQKAVMWEAQAVNGEKEKYKSLRQEIEKQQQQLQQIVINNYKKDTQKLAQKQTVVKNTIWAFFVGGLICTFGQAVALLFMNNGLLEKEAGSATTVILIFLGALLTGLGYYDQIGKVAGAGSIVPITGFANSIVSSALEFKTEGFIYGVGARLFTVAGPVIVYGLAVSLAIGLIYYFI